MNRKKHWLLVSVLCLASCTAAQRPSWKIYYDAGLKAYQQGRYSDAEKLYSSAVKEAERSGTQDSLAMTLNNLGLVLYAQGKYTEAEPLYKRALEIRRETLGPEHPEVSASLNNLAQLYRAQGKNAEAEALASQQKTSPEQSRPEVIPVEEEPASRVVSERLIVSRDKLAGGRIVPASLKGSRDSKRVTYIVAVGDKWLVVVDGKEEKPYDEIWAESFLFFSPDSRRIAYAARTDARWLVVVDGKEEKPYDGV
ncbi:MAG: tetratricopeptide repeat protein, partial [Deltaproteobacteria bacterium]|nr:tetratricopeptide repeat protein [Deltaproteobacteria bacterium]